MIVNAVIVTFYPVYYVIEEVIKSLELQVDKIIIIDNTPDNSSFFLSQFSNDVIYLQKNIGIAHAQNIGIKKAIEKNADFILLCDQDTIFPENFVESMVNCYYLARQQYPRVSAINPLYFNETKKNYERIAITKFTTRNPEIAQKYIKAEHSISSGSLIPSDAFSTIGLMNGDLFIDYVDFDWFWRGNAIGYVNICNTRISVNHKLGDDSKKILHQKITIRSDFRYYYMIRNGFYLALYSDYMLFHERVLFICRLLIMSAGIIIIRKKRLDSVFLLLLAFHHAITCNLGEKSTG